MVGTEAAGRHAGWDRVPAMQAILRQAALRGLSPRDGGDGLWHVGEGRHLCRFDHQFSDRTPFLAAQLCHSRWLTHEALTQAGLPVPQSAAAASVADAVARAAVVDGPVVLRPIRSGALSRPSGAADGAAAVAAAYAALPPGGVLVSAAVRGQAYRFIVLDGVAVQGPPAAHPLNVRLVERAAAVCQIELAVVELTIADVRQPFPAAGGMLTALDPGLLPAALAAHGDGAALAARYLDHLYPPPANGRIPILAVIGGNGDAVAAILGTALAAVGRSVGIATRHGLSVGGLTLFLDDRRGSDALALLVDHQSVDAAVVEIEAAGLPRRGLGHPAVDLVLFGDGPVDADTVAWLADRTRLGFIAPAGRLPDGRMLDGASKAGLVHFPAADRRPDSLAAAAIAALAVTHR
ncbi:hypothetical protein EDC65_1920 [Stella humosa]|uniref:ATP-grasp domain-containing protein n=1 Tax=Stella humosa TaxID=94 RepID=A0A3N1LY38_9PROT|nr:hypothetical protein [Stella humosa]ROQ00124.1 hypothetical protein EDC65_1920 [Stella humosa]BBK30642.1 hypothetical protein STHU_12760 [Stella humosa]